MQAQGESMEPTLDAQGDVVLWRKVHPSKVKQLERGTLVAALSPLNPTMPILKRIVALPGDRILYNGEPYKIPKGHVWIEGLKLFSMHALCSMTYALCSMFCMLCVDGSCTGDCKEKSRDSRTYGAVPMGLVFGVVVMRVWPAKRIPPYTQPSILLDS